MADVIQQGVTPVAHSIINPQDPVYRDVEASIVRYEYDPRRAAQIIEGLGYVRGTDGFRDSANQKLSVELRTSTTRDVSGKAVNAIANYWQRAGVGVDISITPAQLARDVEYRETFPAFELAQNPNAVSALASFGPDPAGRVIRGRYSYRNPELDALIERLFVTVDPRERVPILRGIIHHMTDQVRGLGLFYGADPFLISNRLRNIGPGNQEADMAWNAHEWEVTEGGTESR